MAGSSAPAANGTAAAASKAPTATAAAGEGQAAGWTPDMENDSLATYLLWVCAILGGALIAWRVTIVLSHYIRRVACIPNDTQRYFARGNTKFSWLKKNILYSPMFSKRRNREFQLSKATNMGTLPTRLQFVFLLGYFATNVAFCVINIPFQDFTNGGRQLRNRSGTLAVVNMIPLFIMASRNNPLIKWLGIDFDTFNLLHRWFGRIVALEAVCHTVAYMVVAASTTGWSKMMQQVVASPMKLWGLIATIAFVVILFQAASISRHAFYESFKVLHIGLAALAIAGLWYHLTLTDKLPQIKWLIGVIPIWIIERTLRFARIAWGNFGKGGTKTLVEALPGDCVRVTVTMVRPWTFKPGQHAYLYMPSIGFWQSHPFSAAWSEEAEDLDSEKLAMNRQDILAMRNTNMSFVIRARTGMTKTLYERAAQQPEGRLSTTCYVEGPYGGVHQLHSYGTVMLFAGGVGITHQVPHVRELVAGYANGTVATRKVVLVWIIQSPEHLEWIRPWMTEILAMDKRRDVLKVMLFVSRPRSTKEIHSPSSTVQMFPGRPNIDTLMGMEMETQIGAMAVSICGPGALSDEVRRAVRRNQYRGAVDFIDETFSW